MEALDGGVSAPQSLALAKMETLVRDMQSHESGVPVRGQKMFLTTIPSAFMGYDLIEWLMTNLPIEDSVEALHLASLLCQYGYFFPVGDAKTLQVKDDSSLYRFQTPYYWPSQNHVPDATDYAIYIHKKILKNKQKNVLEEYELEAYSQLKKTLASKWDFIVMQAEEQLKMAKDRKKGDKIVSESQERAYWRVYRPPPGFTNTLECPPVPDRSRPGGAGRRQSPTSLTAELQFLQNCLVRSRTKVSQEAESLISSYETYLEFDPLLSPVLPSNPWLTDDPTFLELNVPLVDCPTEWRVRRWAISMDEMVSDPTGLQEITNCMKKEFSHENIRFWTAVHHLKKAPLRDVKDRVNDIYSEFLCPGAPCEINIDGKTMERTHAMMENPSRFTFDSAAEHIYELLLKKDCYPRFLRSEHYKSLLTNATNPTSKKRFFPFGAAGKKKVSSVVPPNHNQVAAGPGRHGCEDPVSPGPRHDGDNSRRDSDAGIFLGGPSRLSAGSLPKLTLPTSPAATAAGPASAPATAPVPPAAFTAAPPPQSPAAAATPTTSPATQKPATAEKPASSSKSAPTAPDQVCEEVVPSARSSMSPQSAAAVTSLAPSTASPASPLCVAFVEGSAASVPPIDAEKPDLEPLAILPPEGFQDAAEAASLATIDETPEPAEAAPAGSRRRERLVSGAAPLEEDPRGRKPEKRECQRHGSADCRHEVRELRESRGKCGGEERRCRRRSAGERRRREQATTDTEPRSGSAKKTNVVAPSEPQPLQKRDDDAVCPWEHDLSNPTWV